VPLLFTVRLHFLSGTLKESLFFRKKDMQHIRLARHILPLHRDTTVFVPTKKYTTIYAGGSIFQKSSSTSISCHYYLPYGYIFLAALSRNIFSFEKKICCTSDLQGISYLYTGILLYSNLRKNIPRSTRVVQFFKSLPQCTILAFRAIIIYRTATFS
jgi:hypothetical protein